MSSPPKAHPLTVAVATVCLLLAGCSPSDAPTTPSTPTPSATPTASASTMASPSPTSTLTPAQQQAVDEAAAVVLAYEQMFLDLLADPEPYLNDINSVAAQPQLDLDLRNLQQLVVDVAQGKTVVESTGPVTLASVEPVKIKLNGDPPTVTLLVCVDKTATRVTYKDEPWDSSPRLAQYRVVKTTYLPSPGWAVSKVLPPPGLDQPQPC